MKKIFLLRKSVVMAVAALFMLNLCALPAFAQMALGMGESSSSGAVYSSQKSVKDSFVMKENDNDKQQITDENKVVQKAKNKSFFGSIFQRLLDIIENIVSMFKEKENEQESKYNAVVDKLAEQSGLDKSVIEAGLSQLSKDQLNNAIDLLSEMFENNGNIISCGLYALGDALNIPAGEAAFLALITDIKIGHFRKDVLDENFLYGVSAEAQMEVLRAFGYEKAAFYKMPFDSFMNLFQAGDTAILNLNLTVEGEGTFGHVVTVKKEVDAETGEIQYAIFDNNQKTVYSEDDFVSLLRGDKSVTTNTPSGAVKEFKYNAVKPDGKIEFIPAANEIWKASDTRALFPMENADIQSMLGNLIALIKK